MKYSNIWSYVGHSYLDHDSVKTFLSYEKNRRQLAIWYGRWQAEVQWKNWDWPSWVTDTSEKVQESDGVGYNNDDGDNGMMVVVVELLTFWASQHLPNIVRVWFHLFFVEILVVGTVLIPSLQMKKIKHKS